MLSLDTAIVMVFVFVIGYFVGVYTEKKYGKKNVSIYNNMVSKRRRY